MDKPENKTEQPFPVRESAQLFSAVQPPSAEEPIDLKKLFPDTTQDLDALFPDPAMKKLLREIVGTRKRNETFVKRLQNEVGDEEEDPE